MKQRTERLESCFSKFCLERSYQPTKADIASCYSAFIKHSCLWLPSVSGKSFFSQFKAENLMQQYKFRFSLHNLLSVLFQLQTRSCWNPPGAQPRSHPHDVLLLFLCFSFSILLITVPLFEIPTFHSHSLCICFSLIILNTYLIFSFFGRMLLGLLPPLFWKNARYFSPL